MYSLTVEQVIQFVGDCQPVTEEMVANHFGCHFITARRKLEGAVARKEVIVDDHDPEGRPLNKGKWRYALAT